MSSQPPVLSPRFSVGDAVAALEAGRLVGVPTDTVYGIAAHPNQKLAMQALGALKGRSPGHPIALLVANIDQAAALCVITDRACSLARRHWPGPLTMILEAVAGLPGWIGDPERGTVGVRVPDHPVALDLLGRTGGLAVSSANRSGEPPATNHHEARAIFGDTVAGYLEGEGRAGLASTVLDLTVQPLVVLRQGPLVIEEIER
jgi:tRNA threonylcarbamoyl adenosine modification protein (Sua5/YciO/YrdC/YwlC family)